MKKKIAKFALLSLLASGVVFLDNAVVPTFVGIPTVATAQAQTKVEHHNVKGKISNISQKAKTIALAKKDNSTFFLKFTDETTLKGVESTKEFKTGEAIIAQYKEVDGEHIATSLEKALVKLPKGVSEIKTDALVDLMKTNKDLVIIDARPPVKYAESHIPGSVSLPFAKLVKAGDKGAELLVKYKDKQLVFYCGGNT